MNRFNRAVGMLELTSVIYHGYETSQHAHGKMKMTYVFKVDERISNTSFMSYATFKDNFRLTCSYWQSLQPLA